MEVIVAEDQLSLAIGKRGQNVRLASRLVGWNLDIKSEIEKKSEVEAEMERMEQAIEELHRLPEIAPAVSQFLLDAGFRTTEEVSLASMEDLVSIDGIDEETALAVHDAAEELLEVLIREAEEAAVRAAEEAAVREAEEAAALEAEEAAALEAEETGDGEAAVEASFENDTEETKEHAGAEADDAAGVIADSDEPEKRT